MAHRIEPAKILETLVQNAQKGEAYRVKLTEDPIVYEGIPISRPGETSHEQDAFRFEVTSPPEHAGLGHHRISDIEWIEPVR
jgi:hypothetical protein